MASVSMAVPQVEPAQRWGLHQDDINKADKESWAFEAQAQIQARSSGLIEGKGRDRPDGRGLAASMVIPEMAAAVESGVSLSLKNFLLSIVAGGVVLAAIVGAVIGVSNFDPVKRCWVIYL